jgi:hypothetical protein
METILAGKRPPLKTLNAERSEFVDVATAGLHGAERRSLGAVLIRKTPAGLKSPFNSWPPQSLSSFSATNHAPFTAARENLLRFVPRGFGAVNLK